MVEAELEALTTAVEQTRCPAKVTRWRQGAGAWLGDFLAASITNLESQVNIPRMLFVF
jgi:hypothetical protein